MDRCWACLPILLEARLLTLGRTYTYIMKSQLEISFGEVANRERKHPGEKASGHHGASGKEASGVRGARALERRVAWAFLGLFTVLGLLVLRPGPIGALGLARMAMGTELGPMVPTTILVFSKTMGLFGYSFQNLLFVFENYFLYSKTRKTNKTCLLPDLFCSEKYNEHRKH